MDSDDFPADLNGLFDEAVQATQQPAELTITEELAMPHSRYLDGGKIDSGGSKQIRLVEDGDTGRILAMAVPKDDSPEGGEAFLREARITANLTHPSIIPVYDIGLDEKSQPYFVMKLMEGGNLSDCIMGRTGPDAIPELKSLGARIDLFLKICEAIAYAHSRGVIHLDLKPANIQVGRFGEVLVCDWGLAKIQDEACEDPLLERYSFDDHERRNITLSGRIKGTPGYMAPEQCGAFASRKDCRTDIFSLGCILYELAAFRRAIATGDVRKSIANTRKGKLRPIPKNIPEGLAAVIAKALQFRPENRYLSVDALMADLNAWRQGFATGAEEAGIRRQISLFYGRNRLACLAGIIVLALVVALAGTFVLRLQSSEQNAREALAQVELEQAQRRQLGSQAAPLLVRRAEDAIRLGQLAEAETLIDSVLGIDAGHRKALNLQADLEFLAGRYGGLADAYQSPMTLLQKELRAFAAKRRRAPEAPLAVAELRPLVRRLQLTKSPLGLTFLLVWLDDSSEDIRALAASAIAEWAVDDDLPRVLRVLPQLPDQFHEPVVARILTQGKNLPVGLLDRLIPSMPLLKLSQETRDILRARLGTNLALGAVIRCSALSSSSPETLIDGDLSPRSLWACNASPVEIVIDLGGARRIGSVALFAAADLPATRVYLSQDGNEFVEAGSKPSMPIPQGGLPVVFWLDAPQSARFVRLDLRRYDRRRQIALREIQVRDPFSNLALGRPTNSSGKDMRGYSGFAVNGLAPLNQFWEENEPPVYLTVDFGATHRINETRASFYHDGSRYYQYEILVSTDGRNYAQVVDRRNNRKISEEDPYVDQFEAVDARFVQIKVWKNSANPGVHIREFEVFPVSTFPE